MVSLRGARQAAAKTGIELQHVMKESHVKFNLYENSLASREEITNSEGKTHIPNHHFLVGFYKGYFGMILNEQIICKETICVNKGDKFCQFEITKFR